MHELFLKYLALCQKIQRECETNRIDISAVRGSNYCYIELFLYNHDAFLEKGDGKGGAKITLQFRNEKSYISKRGFSKWFELYNYITLNNPIMEFAQIADWFNTHKEDYQLK